MDIGAYEWHSNFAPYASAGEDRTVLPGTSVGFDSAGSRDPDGSIAGYDWDFGDGSAHASTATASHTYASVGVYTATLTVTDELGATGTDTVVITVASNLPPVAKPGQDQFVVSNTSVTFDGGGSSDADGTLISFAWDFGDGLTASGPLVAHTYARDGIYEVTLTVTDNRGATGVGTCKVVVGSGISNTLPVSRPGGPYSGTVGKPVSFDGRGSTDSDGSISTWAWTFGDGASGSGPTPTHTYGSAGTYLATLIVTDDKGGQGKDSVLVTVGATPNAAPVARGGGNKTGTVGDTIAFDGSGSSDADGTVVSYLWDFGDGAVANGATASHAWAAAGSYLLTLTVSDDRGATGFDIAIVTIDDVPNLPPVANAGPDRVATRGVAVAFDGSGSTDADGTIESWTWDFGDGTVGTGAKVSHSYPAAGTYLVELVVTDDRGGSGTDVALVVVTAPVNQAPLADAGGGHVAAIAQSITFDGRASRDPDGTIASYFWDFGDGTTGTGAQAWHAYADAGSYLVRLTVTDDQGATASDVAIASIGGGGGGASGNVPPHAVAGPDRRALVRVSVSFDGGGSTDADGTLSEWAWDFGDGSTATGRSVAHAWTAAGTYLVRLTVTDDAGAQDTGYALVNVSDPASGGNLPPVARPGGPRAGLVGQAIAFDGSASSDPDGTIVSYQWDFGDGTGASTASATHAYPAAGVYLARLTVIDDRGASSQDSVVVSVAAKPNLLPIARSGGNKAGLVNQPVNFDGSGSTDADGRIVGWSWDFGDGVTADGVQAAHAWSQAGTYLVRLTVTDDRGATAQDVAVATVGEKANAAPIARAGGNRAGLPGQAIVFDGGASSDPDGTIVAYAWDFGDGSIGTGANVEHVFAAAGIYLVTLEVRDDRGASARDLVVVRVLDEGAEAPVAEAGGNRSADVGQELVFDASASTATAGELVGYEWDFGDGTTGSGAQVSHVFAQAGSFLVRLTVTDDQGGSGQDIVIVVVADPGNQAPIPAISAAHSAMVGDEVAFDGAGSSDPDGSITAFVWDFGDGATAEGAQVSHVYSETGGYLVRLTVTDDRGRTAQQFTVVTVFPVGAPVESGGCSSVPGGALAPLAALLLLLPAGVRRRRR